MQEQLLKELDKILKKMEGLDPTSDAYRIALQNFHEVERALHEDLKSCEDDLNGRSQRDLKRGELELAKKRQEMEELNNRIQNQLKQQQLELDQRKQEEIEREGRNRLLIAKIEAIFGLAKIVLVILGALAAIILTGKLEETTILSAKCLSWIKWLTPKIL